jgi:hypothetical protein
MPRRDTNCECATNNTYYWNNRSKAIAVGLTQDGCRSPIWPESPIRMAQPTPFKGRTACAKTPRQHGYRRRQAGLPDRESRQGVELIQLVDPMAGAPIPRVRSMRRRACGPPVRPPFGDSHGQVRQNVSLAENAGSLRRQRIPSRDHARRRIKRRHFSESGGAAERIGPRTLAGRSGAIDVTIAQNVYWSAR